MNIAEFIFTPQKQYKGFAASGLESIGWNDVKVVSFSKADAAASHR